MRRYFLGFFFLFSALALASCQTGFSPGNQETNQSTAPEYSAAHSAPDVCIGELTINALNPNAAAEMPTLSDDLELGTLGIQGTEDLLGQYLSIENTFCSSELSDKILERLTEIERLVNEGKETEAQDLLNNLLEEVIEELNSISSSSSSHAKTARLYLAIDKENAHRLVREFLNIAAQAQLLGMDDLAEDALNQASETFNDWASEAIKNTTDLSEALEIAAQAQLLGLENGLDDIALDKAREIVQQMLTKAMKGFSVCDSPLEQARDILSKAALAQLLGVEGGDPENAIDLVLEWKVIQEKKANNEPVPECSAQSFKLEESFAEGFMTVTGFGYTCDGENWQIEISGSGSPAGAPITFSGALDFPVIDGSSGSLLLPVTGTATFDEHQANFEDPLSFTLTILEDATAHISLSSTGQGTIETPIGSIPFVALPGDTVEVTLEPHQCEQN